MTITLHSPQVHGFFSVPTDPLTARPLFVKYLCDRNLDPNETIVVAPDIGRAKSAARFAARLGLTIATADKQRIADNNVVIGPGLDKQVEGYRRALIYDDEIATGTSVMTLSKRLIKRGIEEICAICTHGVFVDNALSRLAAIPQVTEIITTDTVPIADEKRDPKLTILSVAPIFGDAIAHNYNRRSIGDLFTFSDDENSGDE